MTCWSTLRRIAVQGYGILVTDEPKQKPTTTHSELQAQGSLMTDIKLEQYTGT